jgi:hypothetical protein
MLAVLKLAESGRAVTALWKCPDLMNWRKEGRGIVA